VSTVSDIDDELRELFLRRAEDVPPHREVPRTLVSRARRRIARNALGAGVVVVVLAAGGFAGVRALSGLPVPRQPVGSVSPSPAQPGPSGSAISACTPGQLRAVGSMEGAAGSREGGIDVTNLSGETCTLQGTPAITLLDQNLNPVTSGVTFSSAPAGWVVNVLPKPAGWPVVTLRPGDSASVRVSWSNWCPDGRAAPLWRLGIPGGGAVDVGGLEAVTPPPCNGPGLPSTIEVGPFEPPAGP
jgi:hypothetical protein